MVIEPGYPLRTSRLDLRPFTADDFAGLHAMHSDPAVVRYLHWEPHDEAATEVALARRMRNTTLIDAGDSLSIAVVVRETGALAGDATFFWHNEQCRQGEIGYVFNPAFQGRGYATEAAAELLRFGFEVVGLHRITGRLDGRNTASARVLERLGMRREAHLRQNGLVKGEWTDEVVYALLADEWRARSDRT